jgi:hypothetical protein
MEFNGPEVLRVRPAKKAGYFGLGFYPRAVVVLGCQLTQTGAYATGLNKEEEVHYEKLLELKPGDLAPHSKWWTNVFNVEYPIRLTGNKTTVIPLDNPLNQIKYKVLLKHDKIANSELEINSRPDILFYIDDPEVKAKEELKVINFKVEGSKFILNLTPEKKKTSLRLFGKTGVDNITEDMATTQLFAEMERNPKEFFDVMTDPKLEAKAWIEELIEKGMIKRIGSTYKHNDEIIAGGIEECIDYLNKHDDVKLSLKSKAAKIKK